MDTFHSRTIRVDGHEVTLDTEGDLTVGALSGDMDKVASQMGYWGNVWAAAVEEAGKADAFYRQWRAQTIMAILDSDPKLAEWKVKAGVEVHPTFVKYKSALALADANVIAAKTAFDSFSKKANTLQSKGAMSRAELDATGLYTPVEPRKAPKSKKRQRTKKEHYVVDDPRISAMRQMRRKK